MDCKMCSKAVGPKGFGTRDWFPGRESFQGLEQGEAGRGVGWVRVGLEGQTDFPALATHSQIPFQPEKMLQNDFCLSPPGQESYRLGQNLRNSGIPKMLILWCETWRWV